VLREEFAVLGLKGFEQRFNVEELAGEDLKPSSDIVGLSSCGIGITFFAADEGPYADGGIAHGLNLCGIEFLLDGVDVGVLLHRGIGHVGERGGGLCGSPGDVVEPVDTEVDLHGRVGGRLVVRGDVAENFDVVFNRGLLFFDLVKRGGDGFGVVFDLGVQAGLGLMDEVTVMSTLDASLEAEGDEKTDGDGKEVDEEVADAVHSGVRGMYFEHRRTSLKELVPSVSKLMKRASMMRSCTYCTKPRAFAVENEQEFHSFHRKWLFTQQNQ